MIAFVERIVVAAGKCCCSGNAVGDLVRVPSGQDMELVTPEGSCFVHSVLPDGLRDALWRCALSSEALEADSCVLRCSAGYGPEKGAVT